MKPLTKGSKKRLGFGVHKPELFPGKNPELQREKPQAAYDGKCFGKSLAWA